MRRHQGWDDFELLVVAGDPAIVTIPGSPRAELFVEPNGARIGLRIDSSAAAPTSPLVEIGLRCTLCQNRRVLEVSVDNPSLYREFYDFVCSVSDRAQLEAKPPNIALEESLQAWSGLLQRASLLSSDREIGLLGELWVLARIAKGLGYHQAVEAWRGSDAEEHDFGLPLIDIEVKTTTGERRLHTIATETQLQPSPNRPLYLLSQQLTRNAIAIEGFTLASMITNIRGGLANHPSVRQLFEPKLRRAGWRDEYSDYYTRRFVPRSPFVLIRLPDECPAITRDVIATLGRERASRILRVSYQIDVTGLGIKDGTPELLTLIPSSGDNA